MGAGEVTAGLLEERRLSWAPSQILTSISDRSLHLTSTLVPESSELDAAHRWSPHRAAAKFMRDTGVLCIWVWVWGESLAYL